MTDPNSAQKARLDLGYMINNTTTPNFKYFLVFKIEQFLTSKRPGLNDFCLSFEMEESWALEA